MENTIFSGRQAPSAAYDYRIYDQVWQRVSPGVDPYAEDPAAAGPEEGSSGAPTAGLPPEIRQEGGGEGNLPGAAPNPCCMGSSAQESVEVLEGFIQEELAGSRCCQDLADCVRSQGAARLLRRIACEKQAAARELRGACYLITGSRYAPAIAVERAHWDSLAQALRSCYHQEACNGLNYARAGEEALDPCLQKLLARLGEQAYQRAEDVMRLLGRILG